MQELKHAKEQEHHGEHKPTQSNKSSSSSSSLLEKLFSNEDAANVKPYSSKSLSKQQDAIGREHINNIYLSDETSSNRNEIKNIQNTHEQDDMFYDETNELSNKNRNNLIDNENELSNDEDGVDEDGVDEDDEDDAQSPSETNLDDINSVDSKDKRRHYLIKSKQLADSGKFKSFNAI